MTQALKEVKIFLCSSKDGTITYLNCFERWKLQIPSVICKPLRVSFEGLDHFIAFKVVSKELRLNVFWGNYYSICWSKNTVIWGVAACALLHPH